MTQTLIPISRNHKTDNTSKVYSVLNRTKCLSCHRVWSLPHSGDEVPANFFRTPPAISREMLRVEDDGCEHMHSVTPFRSATTRWVLGQFTCSFCQGYILVDCECNTSQIHIYKKKIAIRPHLHPSACYTKAQCNNSNKIALFEKKKKGRIVLSFLIIVLLYYSTGLGVKPIWRVAKV